MLSKKQKKKILTALIEKDAYKKLSSPEEIHQFVMKWNWDSGVEPLKWIIRQKRCDLGTALLIYWYAQPQWFNKFTNREEVIENDNYNLKTYDLIVEIEIRVKNNFYILKDIYFDPANHEGHNLTKSHFGKHKKRLIPIEMFSKNDGIVVKSENLIEKHFKDVTLSLNRKISREISKGFQLLKEKVQIIPEDEPLDVIYAIQKFINSMKLELNFYTKDHKRIASRVGWVFAEQVRRKYNWNWKLCFYNEEKEINLLSHDNQYVIKPNSVLFLFSDKNVIVRFFKTIGKAKKTQDFSEFYAVGMIFLETDWN